VREEYTAAQAKTRFAEILQKVARENRVIVVTRYGKPIAQIAPVTSMKRRRPILGSLSGKFHMPDEGMTPMTEAEADDFLGLK
jgi:prevent-host-death family protein